MTRDDGQTEKTRSRYERIAPVYDLMEAAAELRYRPWRRRLWSMVRAPRVLEVGVGTGKNMPFYPADTEMTAIDLTPGMLKRAQRRARRMSIDVELRLGDAQDLDFATDSFDAAVATFVFCSVPDPERGLQEMARVVRPGGRILLLEHVRSGLPGLGPLMDLFNPLVVRIVGANINRRTVRTVERSGLALEDVQELDPLDIFKLIIASPGRA